MEPIVTEYKYLNFYKGSYDRCRCEIKQLFPKTVLIKLLECGPYGARPGTLLRVHKKSLKLYQQ